MHYMERGGTQVSRAEFEANLAAKLDDPMFHRDLGPLLAPVPPEMEPFDVACAARLVLTHFIARLPGEPWRGRR
jgi:hypothetical protein